MSKERWNSPFVHSIAFILFKKHFTELNKIYWAHVPAASTIEKKAFEALKSEDVDPKKYFLIPDKDDRRIALTFSEWKTDYREFSNYTRLNMLMLLSSCLETYLRTVVSLSLESNPGVIIKATHKVDGWFLLRDDIDYGDYNGKKYQFRDIVNSITQGDWTSRASAFTKYFGNFPLDENVLTKLDDLRQKRNMVGHYLGRDKQKYEAPLYFEPTPVLHISHETLIKFFTLVYDSVLEIDKFLLDEHIGSYDVLKYYYLHFEPGSTGDISVGAQAKELQKALGGLGLIPAGTEYYQNIVSYAFINCDNTCMYSRKITIKMVNRKLREENICIYRGDRRIAFSKYHLKLFCKVYSLHSNSEYSAKHTPKGKTEYFYSSKTIDLIVSEIRKEPTTVITKLQSICESMKNK